MLLGANTFGFGRNCALACECVVVPPEPPDPIQAPRMAAGAVGGLKL